MAKVAVVTGANKGIGLEITRALASLEDEYKIILGCRSPERGSSAVSQLQREFKNRSFAFVYLDLCKEQTINEFVKAVSLQQDHVDVLFHNAAIAPGYREDIDLTMNTNYFGTVKLNKLMLPLLEKSAKPSVVVLSSLLLKDAYSGCSNTVRARWRNAESEAAINELLHEYLRAVETRREREQGWPRLAKNTVYSVSKLAVTTVAALWAKEYPNIMVNSVCPGWCKTDMSRLRGPRSPRKGAATPLWLGTFGAGESTGKFWHDKKQVDIF